MVSLGPNSIGRVYGYIDIGTPQNSIGDFGGSDFRMPKDLPPKSRPLCALAQICVRMAKAPARTSELLKV